MVSSIAITNRSLHDQVANRVRDLIIDGTLEPGSRIDEAHLIENLGVSRTPFREALRTLADEEIEVLVELHERMMNFYGKRDRMPYYKLNQEFHSRLAELSKNETLKEMQSNIQARLKRIRYIGSQNLDSWEGAVADHEEMVLALKGRDGERLGEAMASHLLKTWDRVKDSI